MTKMFSKRRLLAYLVIAVTLFLAVPQLQAFADDATAVSIQSFQELTGLPQTGELDRITWKQLALHYPLASNDRRFASSRTKAVIKP